MIISTIYKKMKCSSCNNQTSRGVILPCPKCGEKLARCERCRDLSINYQCNKCHHKGP